MSGKKSSVKDTAKKRDISLSAGLHDFLYVIGKNYWVFLVMLAFFIIAIPFFTAGLPGDSIFNVEVTHDQLKYSLVGGMGSYLLSPFRIRKKRRSFSHWD